MARVRTYHAEIPAMLPPKPDPVRYPVQSSNHVKANHDYCDRSCHGSHDLKSWKRYRKHQYRQKTDHVGSPGGMRRRAPAGRRLVMVLDVSEMESELVTFLVTTS